METTKKYIFSVLIFIQNNEPCLQDIKNKCFDFRVIFFGQFKLMEFFPKWRKEFQ